MIWNWEYALDILPTLLVAFVQYTLLATVLGSLLGASLGLVFAVVRRSGLPVLTQLLTVFIEVVRSTPIPLQLFAVFYVLPLVGGPILEPLTAGVVVLGVHYACYYVEVYRAGIDAVPVAQWEAATALSLGRRYTWLDVVLPQAIRNVLPSLGNYAISMFKETPFL
ncbi:MAG: ABC transporter permease subunit, partial [Pseudonocardia sp.]|nr:ABC transporter permease subunit [Pseudonocardia sp.]